MCDCNATVNEQLAADNTMIETPWYPPHLAMRTFVRTVKKEEGKRGKPRSMFATFCPFCGEKYPEADSKGEAY